MSEDSWSTHASGAAEIAALEAKGRTRDTPEASSEEEEEEEGEEESEGGSNGGALQCESPGETSFATHSSGLREPAIAARPPQGQAEAEAGGEEEEEEEEGDEVPGDTVVTATMPLPAGRAHTRPASDAPQSAAPSRRSSVAASARPASSSALAPALRVPSRTSSRLNEHEATAPQRPPVRRPSGRTARPGSVAEAPLCRASDPATSRRGSVQDRPLHADPHPEPDSAASDPTEHPLPGPAYTPGNDALRPPEPPRSAPATASDAAAPAAGTVKPPQSRRSSQQLTQSEALGVSRESRSAGSAASTPAECVARLPSRGAAAAPAPAAQPSLPARRAPSAVSGTPQSAAQDPPERLPPPPGGRTPSASESSEPPRRTRRRHPGGERHLSPSQPRERVTAAHEMLWRSRGAAGSSHGSEAPPSPFAAAHDHLQWGASGGLPARERGADIAVLSSRLREAEARSAAAERRLARLESLAEAEAARHNWEREVLMAELREAAAERRRLAGAAAAASQEAAQLRGTLLRAGLGPADVLLGPGAPAPAAAAHLRRRPPPPTPPDPDAALLLPGPAHASPHPATPGPCGAGQLTGASAPAADPEWVDRTLGVLGRGPPREPWSFGT
eukprot:TRINITY_DN19324_c0_g2_i2.p1 TRINITY_DN19324_c0_g2~~TRINITY_DN19324_c0_g2_i2.p1  ORF type:complete len:618 (+),score=120.11 TRINITY_DN19324_c0_g2_i2:74-1927(+)